MLAFSLLLRKIIQKMKMVYHAFYILKVEEAQYK